MSGLLNMVDVVGQIADLKTVDYHNTLAVSVLIELLIDKGVITRQEFAHKAQELESASLAEIALMRRSGMR